MGDTATRLESDLDSDLESFRSSTLRGMDFILPRVKALSSYPDAGVPSLGPPAPDTHPLTTTASPFQPYGEEEEGEALWGFWLTRVWKMVR